MTTTDPVHKTPRHFNSNTAILQLERINKNLLSLKTKLSSYMCEPKTLSLYQRMQSLRTNLEQLLADNLDLKMRLRNTIGDDGKSKVQDQFESYKKLELKVLEYIGMAKMHC